MSHFPVLVIGDNVEQQLAPYHEFECTGINDQYVQDIDVTEELAAEIAEGKSIDEALGYYSLEDKIVASESEVNNVGNDCPHKYGYAIVHDGKLIKAVNRTNPNKTWDWWVEGGRWSRFLKLKGGDVRADQAAKVDIDFQGMRDSAGRDAATEWDKAAAAKLAAGMDAGASWDDWKTVRERHPGDVDAAREEYHAQPALKAVRTVFDNPFFDADPFRVDRETYVQRARDGATVLYAIVKDAQWIAKGEMGWFGMSDDKVSHDDWNRKVNAMLDDLPDDTLITVVDCHI